MLEIIVQVPRTLEKMLAASKGACTVELIRADNTRRSVFRVVPARAGALLTGLLTASDGKEKLCPRDPLFIIDLSSAEPQVRNRSFTGDILGVSSTTDFVFVVEIFDDAEGKGRRRKELLSASEGALSSAKIGLIGLGSLGSSFFSLMLRDGFRRFAGVDDDRVEGHNACKSLVYSGEHVGFLKTEALASWGKAVEPALDFSEFPRQFDVGFMREDGDTFLEGMSLLYVSANNIQAINQITSWLDGRRAAGVAAPLVLTQLVFENARAGICMYWDPQDAQAPCPGCFFAMNLGIHDVTAEDVDPADYTPLKVSNSTPQIASDIAHHVSLAAGYAVGLLTGSAERLDVLASRPWLYSFAMRGAASHLEWTSTEHAGQTFLWPTYPGAPFMGCSCCRSAGRVRDEAPQFPDRRAS